MNPLWQKILQLVHSRQLLSRRGQTIVEYSLILAVIGFILLAAFSRLSQELVVIFSGITTLLDSAQSSTF